MKAHILQHVSFEGPGAVADWLDSAGYSQTFTRFYQDSELPELEEVDLLVVLGGPMSVNDEKQYPWLAEEKAFIHRVLHSGRPVLGICLGAQLMASALGARVYRNPAKEIGWFPLWAVAQGTEVGLYPHEVFRFPLTLEVFHWHGETFDLPQGALRLAESEGCENQAFQWGKAAIGLQFHLETTSEAALEIVTHCRHELMPGEFIQTESQMLSASEERYRTLNTWMGYVLAFLTGRNAEQA